MPINSDREKNRLHFQIRKAIFQVALPVLLGLLTLLDYASSPKNNLYFYTSLLLFLHISAQKVLQFIFSWSSTKVVFRRLIDSSLSTSIMATDINDLTNTNVNSNNHAIVTVKKIFKLKYVDHTFFKIVTNVCWKLGIDCPVLIPIDVVKNLSCPNGLSGTDIHQVDEDVLLHSVLLSLEKYQPKILRVTSETPGESISVAYPTRIITQLDRSICELQENFFDKEIDIDVQQQNTNIPTDNPTETVVQL